MGRVSEHFDWNFTTGVVQTKEREKNNQILGEMNNRNHTIMWLMRILKGEKREMGKLCIFENVLNALSIKNIITICLV